MDKYTLSAGRLADGSVLRYTDNQQYPKWVNEQGVDENRLVYAALAHAHFALATLRGATITFPQGQKPPVDTTLTAPGLRRFAKQLALLDLALKIHGVEPEAEIPMPRVREMK